MKNKEKWFFVVGIATLMGLCSIAGFHIGVDSVAKPSGFYSDEFECDLILEQLCASYRGCNILWDILRYDYNFTDQNLSIARLECIEYLENLYYVEFDDSGDVCFCEYNHAEKST